MTASDELLKALAEALVDVAVVICSADGRIEWLSAGACELLGRGAEEVVGQSARALLDEGAPAGAIQRGDGEPVEVSRRRAPLPDGAWIEVLERRDTATARDQEQLLKYAQDVARSHVAEREKAKDLEVALSKLEDAYRQLERANEQVSEQRDTLAERVQTREQELEKARAQLDHLIGGDGTVIFQGMVSGEAAMLRVFETVRLVATSDASVLIHGESGTGKELVARALHQESPRRAKPFVAVNCAAITPTLAESLLFGHVKGAFTGAISAHNGAFREAHEGTLFLDEVAELPLEIQSKLLRVVQEKVVTPVGSAASVPISVRLVAASHRSLPDEVRAGRFREDLMYRLRVVPIDLPPLRARKGDLPRLLRHTMARLNAASGKAIESLTPLAVRCLLDYEWPGNVRELENVLQYAFAVSSGDKIGVEHLPSDVVDPVLREGASAPEAPSEAEDELDESQAIGAALEKTGGRVHEAAQLLRMSRATFHRKRKKHGLV